MALSLLDEGIGIDVHGASHLTNKSAHIQSAWETLRVGAGIYHFLFSCSILNTQVALTANTLYACPFIVPRTMTLSGMAISVQAAVAGGVRMGIYADNGSLYPGVLKKDGGAIDCGTTGTKAVTFGSNIQLTKGIYWAVVVSDVTPSLRVVNPAWSPMGCDESGGEVTYRFAYWKVAFTYAALPDPFTAAGTATNIASGYNIAIPVVIASLD